MDQLSGQVAVITGGASGIGLALAHRFADEGMKLVLGDIEQPALDDATAALKERGADVLGVTTDVSDPASVDALRDATLKTFGAVHVVCNNAGVAVGGRVWEIPLEQWHWLLGVNLFGVIHGIRSFVPLLLEQGEGHIVNTASVAGLTSNPGIAPYNVSKHAVVTLSETLHHELAMTGSKVGVSVLCPAFVQTRIHESDRNAPEGVIDEGARTPEVEAIWQFFSAMVHAGIEARAVADAVLDAIVARRFYVLTHPEALPWVEARAQAIISGANPATAMV